MTSPTYQTEFNTLTSQGYRLVDISGYTVNDEERFAAIWEKKPGPAWVARHGMASSEYQSEFKKYAAEGYRLVLVNGYTFHNQDKYVAIWEKSPGPPSIARHGMAQSEYQSEFNRYIAQGYRLSHVSGYSVNDQARYAAIWQKSSGPAWVAKHGMTSPQYQEDFTTLANKGYRLVLVSGYSVGNQVLYAAIWEKGAGCEWLAKHGMTAPEYQRDFENRVDRGFRLKLVNGYTVNGQDRYAAIWEKDPSFQSKLKKPIDTWENIHTFLAQDNNVLESELPLLTRYDFIFSAGRFNHQHQPPIKPEMLVTYYCTGDRDNNVDFILHVDHSLQWYQQNHPDWVVYGCDQKTPAYEFDQKTLIPIDISNPDVVAYLADVYGTWGAAHGEDALAIDNIALQNLVGNPARCGVFKNGKWVQLYSGAQVDSKLAGDVVSFAHQLRLRLHKLSPPQSLVINLVPEDFRHPQQPFFDQLMEEVDGVADEGGFLDFKLDPLTDNDWFQKIQLIRDIQARGTPYYGVNQHGMLPPDPKNIDCSQAGNVPANFKGWSVASYLMSKEHSTAMYMSQTQWYGCAVWFPEYDAKVGHPCGEMYKSQNVYMRNHSKAISIVNPSAGATYQVTLPAGRKYVDLHGVAVGPTIVAPPHSGFVFLVASGPGFCQ